MVGVKLHADGGFFSDSSDGVFFDLDFSRFSFAAATSSSSQGQLEKASGARRPFRGGAAWSP